MAELLLILLLVSGVAGAIAIVLRRRGLMRNGYFTIGTSLIIAFFMIVCYQTIPLLALQFVPEDIRETPGILLSISSLGQLIILVGGTLLLIRATEQDTQATLRLEGISETPGKLYLLGAPMMLLATAVSGGISHFWVQALERLPFYPELEKLNQLNEEQIQKLMAINSPSDFILVMLAVAIVPAIAEEIFFRGFLQTNIERSGNGHARPYTALIVTAIVFASVHFNPFQFPGLLGLGLAMGYMAYRTNNLLVGSFAHAFNNGSAVLAMANMGTLPDETAEMAKLGTGMLLFTIVVCSLLLAFVVYLFHQWSEPLAARHYAELEVRATTAYYAAKELERYNDDLLAELETKERVEQKEQDDLQEAEHKQEEQQNSNDHP